MVERYRSKRKISFIWLTLCIWLCLSGMTAYAECLVQDDAQLFSDSEVQQIETLAKEIETSWQMNVLVMTCDDADGRESNEVLEDTYEEYGLESNDAKGGIALIIDMDNRELNLVTERDMIYYITDYREEKIYDAAQSYASDGEYGNAMIAMLKKVQQYLNEGIPNKQYTYDTEIGRIVRYHSLASGDILLAFFAGLMVAAIVSVVLYRSYTVVKKYRYSTEKNARLKITAQRDILVNQFVTHRRIEKDPPSGGGDSGRTSTHHSSGGHTYGGGKGRGF
mgnify:CR=1 FL=1